MKNIRMLSQSLGEERLHITYVKGVSSRARSRFPRKKRPDKGARNIPY